MYKYIHDSQLQLLQLVRPDVTKRFYQVTSEKDLFVSIDLINGLGSMSRLETLDGSFTLKRQGFFYPQLSIRREREETDWAVLPLDLSGKSCIKIEGQMCKFLPCNLWKNQWAWVNDNNKQIIKYMPLSSGPNRGEVEISKEFVYLPHLEFLVGLGGYFLLQLEDELAHTDTAKNVI